MSKGTTGEAEVIRLRQNIETQMRHRILEAIEVVLDGVVRLTTDHAVEDREALAAIRRLDDGGDDEVSKRKPERAHDDRRQTEQDQRTCMTRARSWRKRA